MSTTTDKLNSNPTVQKVASHPVVQSTVNSVQRQLNVLDKELSKNSVARDFEAKTKVPKTTAFLILAATFFASIFFNLFNLAPAVTNLVGFAIPAYLSVQALESTSTTDDKQWLTYWISFATLTVVESLALNWVLYWVPRWFVFKTVGLVYLQLPSTRGAAKLYEHVIRPVFVQKKLSQANVQNSFATATSTTTSSAPVDDHLKTL